jgi:hypothetical protein
MNTPEARRFIEMFLQPDTDPVLNSHEVEFLLAHAVTKDADDLEPTDDDWTPTYSVRGCHYAISEGWAIKYAKASERFSFTTDGQTFTVNQLLDHCDMMRKRHLAKVQACPSTLEITA